MVRPDVLHEQSAVNGPCIREGALRAALLIVLCGATGQVSEGAA